MAILKASIETFINSCMDDDITATDLTEAIKLCMADLANIGLLVGSNSTLSVSDGDLVLAVPDNYKDVLNLQLTDADSIVKDPLIAFSGGHEEYRRCMADSSTTGTPEYYSEYDGAFYLYPPPDADFDVLIEYQKYSDQDDTAIEFGDEFSNALLFGSVKFYAMMKARVNYINIWGTAYENEKEICRLNMKKQPSITR